MVGFLFAFDVVLSLWGFDPLGKLSVSSAMYIIVDAYMFRTGEVVCIYVSKYLVVEIKVSLADVMLLPLHLETSLNELVNGC